MSKTRKISIVLIQIALVAGVIFAIYNYQAILDRYALLTYKPTAAVSKIVSEISLTDYARSILYRSNPKIDTKAEFNADCETKVGDLELGCYYHKRIFVLSIDNPSLAPEMDVVMAHELLHAGWDRLSATERKELSVELEAFYAGLNDPDLKARMASYAKSEPGEQANELHSILGTEQVTLTPKLEEYYKRYFADRQVIVAAHTKYTEVFESQRRALGSELTTIRTLKSQLNSVNNQMENYKSTGRISQYNALVPKQNQLVDDINTRIDAYQKGVDAYNALSRILDSQQITDTESSVK